MKGKAKFTDRPWKIIDVIGSCTVYAGHIEVLSYFSPSIEVKANAHLIAAAPELYQELSDIAADYYCECGHPRCRIEETRRSIDLLLAKARGEQ